MNVYLERTHVGVRPTASTLRDPTNVAVAKDLRWKTTDALVGVQPVNIINMHEHNKQYQIL